MIDTVTSELTGLSRSELEDMAEAGAEVLDCLRALTKSGSNVLNEVLRGQGPFRDWDHFPEGDVYDRESHAQYYYHAHSKDERPDEHGHFHTFLRPKGMPSGIEPADLVGNEIPSAENEALSHLVAISMDDDGRPIALFTTNRWVTGETWYWAEDVIAMLDCFRLDNAGPSASVNRWIAAMLRLFRPQIAGLLRERDRAIANWRRQHKDSVVLGDRRIEIASQMPISVPEHIRKVRAALCGAARVHGF